MQHQVDEQLAVELLQRYEDFLSILADHDKRNELEKLRMDQVEGNEVFDEARSVARRFDSNLQSMFFETESLIPLISKFGVF